MPVKNIKRRTNDGLEGVITGLTEEEKKILNEAISGGALLVDTVDEMNALLEEKDLKDGQLCYCKETTTLYVLENNTWVEAGGRSGYQIKKLTVTENGVYDSEFEAYKPVVVDITPVSTLKTLLDATQSTYYFFNNYKGTSVDGLISYSDTANVTNMSYMFNHCANLTTIPQLDTSNATDMSYMFQSSQKLTSIPRLDTSKVTNMDSMFYYCSSLTTIPELDTSSVTNMRDMFEYCSNLTSIPKLDTSNVTNMEGTFSDCYKLTSIPQLNTSKVTRMWATFADCSQLTNIPELDTSNVTTMQYFVRHCSKLASIPRLNVSKVTTFSQAFESLSKVTSIGMYGFTCSINISDTALEHDALVAFLNQAGTARDSSQRIYIGSTKLALLSDEEKAIATNKGWTLA